MLDVVADVSQLTKMTGLNESITRVGRLWSEGLQRLPTLVEQDIEDGVARREWRRFA